MKKRNPKRGSKKLPMQNGKVAQLDRENSTKEERREQEAADTSEKVFKSRYNDSAWYSRNRQLVIDAASIPFGAMLGMPNKLGNNTPGLLSTDFTVPGVMALYFIPTPGYSASLKDPINVAARNIYSDVRMANSGARNYDSADLMMYLLAKDSLDMFHAFMKRAYGLASQYTPYNRYYSRSLLRAMGFDPLDVEKNLANFREFINLCAVKLSNMATPKNIPLYDRHAWMCEGIYTDSAAVKAQSYMFVPLQFWKFSNITSENGTELVPQLWFNPAEQVQYNEAAGSWDNDELIAGAGHTVADAVEFFNNLYEGVMLDEDFAIMSGDILKAFGESATIKLDPIPAGYTVSPEFRSEVLSQIENTYVFDMMYYTRTSYGGNITQDPDVNKGAIIYTPTFQSVVDPANDVRVDIWNMNQMMNFHFDNPTPDDVMVASRLMMYANSEVVDGKWNIRPTIFGSEICVGGFILLEPFADGSTNMPVLRVRHQFLVQPAMIGRDLMVYAETCAALANFDWAPGMYSYLQHAAGDNQAYFMGVSLDLDTYTVMTEQTLTSLHQVALLSLLDVG